MHAQAPAEPGCNVSYTKTVTTTTMEPSGNVSRAQTYTWFVPCADAPALPPVGAPDPAVVTRTTSLIGRPQGMHGHQPGVAPPSAAALLCALHGEQRAALQQGCRQRQPQPAGAIVLVGCCQAPAGCPVTVSKVDCCWCACC